MTVEVKDKIQELMERAETDSSGRWVSVDSLEQYTKLVIKECLIAVKQTPTHCAFTTHDLGIVQCTIEKSVKNIKKNFNL